MSTTHRSLFCCHCETEVQARLTDGREIYPHRQDLYDKPMWKCDRCGSYVGCHPGTQSPLGNLPTPELRKARQHIHAILDPAWKSGRMRRKHLYKAMSRELGYSYHTARLRSIEEARRAWKAARKITKL